MAVAFVTMGVGVNARTAFSLLFRRSSTSSAGSAASRPGAFSFGFLVSAVLSPSLGRLMDRRGPRVVMEIGVGCMAAGLMLAPLVTPAVASLRHARRARRRRQRVLGYTGHSLFLPNWFVRRRGLAMSIAFSGVGVGSIILLPWLQA